MMIGITCCIIKNAFKIGIIMKLLKSSLVLVTAIGVASAATPSGQLSRLLGRDVQTVDMINLMQALIMGTSGEDEGSMPSTLGDEFNPGASTATCPFSQNDIQPINRILTDAISYLYGLIDANNNDPETIKQKESYFKGQRELTILAPSYLTFSKKAENTVIENFLNNLLFIQNTVAYNLDQPDEEIRDKAYRQIVKEITGVQKWFKTNVSFKRLEEENLFLWMKPVSIIFSDLQEYFPSNNFAFGNIFQLTNSYTRIDQMDERYTEAAKTVEDARTKYKRRCNKPNTTLKQMEAYWTSTLELPLKMAYLELQEAIKPLLLPFIMNDEIRRKMKNTSRVSGLRRHLVPVKLPAKPAVKTSPKIVELDDIEASASGESPAPEAPSSTMAEEAVMPEEAKAATSEITTALALEEDDSRQYDTDQDEGFQEDDLSPQQLHAQHQARKKTERRTSPQQEEEIVHNPEFYAFLRDTVYGQPQFTWEAFVKEMNRAGFDIIGAEGNVRRVVLKGTNLKFTVHVPAKVRDPMAYKYVYFIRSGLSNVFGLSKEFVTKFLQQ